MKNKVVSLKEAVDLIKDGMTIMVGGFMGIGTPETIVDEIVRRGIKDLTIIANDNAMPGKGIGKLISNKLVKKTIASHIGLNPETGQQMISGELDVELVPQGTLAERIRAHGAGMGGFLTPTGIGTSVQDGKQIITVDGKDYLLELPLKADIALVRASVVDTCGNCQYLGTTRNFNPIIATAADIVIVEGETVVEVGQMSPDHVVTPGLFVDYIVRGEA